MTAPEGRATKFQNNDDVRDKTIRKKIQDDRRRWVQLSMKNIRLKGILLLEMTLR